MNKELSKKTIYDIKYRQEHYKKITIDLPIKQYEEVKQFCNDKNITIKSMFLKGYELTKKEK